jgi:hypothetical protein
MRRVGFQAHDGRIFDTLVARGGVYAGLSRQFLEALSNRRS